MRRPLIFFCGGEPVEVQRKYKIGIQCEPSVQGIIDALERIETNSGWQFDEALKALRREGDVEQYVSAVREAATRKPR